MKKILIIIALAISITGLYSCNDWLDVTPKTEIKGEVLISNQVGFRDALIGVYALMTDASTYGSNLTMATNDVMAQYYDNVRSTIGHNYVNIAAYKYDDAIVANRFANIWKQQYKAIANINLILKFVDEKKNVFTGNNYQIVKGEALALRALLHFDMLRLFAPSLASGGNTPAIPYVDAYTNVSFPQSTVNQTLNNAIADLEKARDLLSDTDSFGPNRSNINTDNDNGILGNRNYRMNYYAVIGLMARIALYKGDQTTALAYAKEVISSNLFPMFGGNASSKADFMFPTEQLFCLKVVGLKTKYADIYFPDLYDSRGPNQLVIDNSSLTTIFPAGINTDYRLQWFEDASSTNKRVTKYSYNDIIPIIKKSEMYLIAAECESNIPVAVANYLNILRAHRGLDNLDGTGMDRTSLQVEIEKEYRKEFIAEGQLFYYYKRLNIAKLPNIAQFDDPTKIYNIPLPQAEIEFGNINQ